MSKLLALLAVALVSCLLMLGCGDNDGSAGAEAAEDDATAAPTEGAPPGVPGFPDLSEDEPPGTTASSGGSEVEMGIGTYCWTRLCVDMIGPITRGTLSVSSGDEVVVKVPAGTPPLREVSVTAFPAGESQELENGGTVWQPDFAGVVELRFEGDADEVRIEAALEPGTYVLVISMYFEAGDVQYGVVLEVD